MKVHVSCMRMTLHDNDISMHENENFAPKTSMDENSMHEIEHSSISHEHFRGKKSSKDFFFGKTFIFMHGHIIFINENKIEFFFSCIKLFAPATRIRCSLVSKMAQQMNRHTMKYV